MATDRLELFKGTRRKTTGLYIELQLLQVQFEAHLGPDDRHLIEQARTTLRTLDDRLKQLMAELMQADGTNPDSSAVPVTTPDGGSR